MAEIEKAQIPIYDFSQADGGSVALRARQPFLISGAIQLADGSRRERAGSQRIPSDVALLKAILLEYDTPPPTRDKARASLMMMRCLATPETISRNTLRMLFMKNIARKSYSPWVPATRMSREAAHTQSL